MMDKEMKKKAMMMSKGEMKKKMAFHEVYKNPPSVVGKTKKKKGSTAARKQMIAIALAKSRQG